jgi:hypothetical protein
MRNISPTSGLGRIHSAVDAQAESYGACVAGDDTEKLYGPESDMAEYMTRAVQTILTGEESLRRVADVLETLDGQDYDEMARSVVQALLTDDDDVMTCEICGEPVDSNGHTLGIDGANWDESCSECGADLFPLFHHL